MKRLLSSLTIMAAIAALAGTPMARPAQAQNFAEGLESLKEMVLVVERLTPASEQCGLVRNELADIMRKEVSNTGLTLTEAGPTLYLNINTAAVGEVCFSAVELNVNYYTQVPHPSRPDGAIAKVVLWEDAFIASSEKSKHKDNINSLVGEMAKDFVANWREANPRTLLMLPDGTTPPGNAPILNAAPSATQ
jgi:hypothetical protein